MSLFEWAVVVLLIVAIYGLWMVDIRLREATAVLNKIHERVVNIAARWGSDY